MPPTAIKKADLTIVRLGLTIVTGFILLRRNNYPESSSEYKFTRASFRFCSARTTGSSFLNPCTVHENIRIFFTPDPPSVPHRKICCCLTYNLSDK